MLLSEFLDSYYIPNRLRGKSPCTFALYRLAIKQFSKTLGRDATLADLTDDNVIKHLSRRTGVAPATRNKELAGLSAMWRYAVQRELHTGWPTVMAETEPLRVPEAWMPEDIAALIASIQRLDGHIGTVPRKLWWEALVRLALDSGERIRAMRVAQWSWLDRSWIKFPAEARKGGKRDRLYLLSQETLGLLAKVRRYSEGDDIFSWPYSHTYLWHMWTKILADAGLQVGRKSGLHRLRKTVASVAYARGLDAQDLMDHSDRRTTQRYLDPRFTRETQASQVISDWLRNPPKPEERERKAE